ncbi:hypothetical protein CHLRE_17g696626v5 [Chlamydomonas reinhardtii]|uniref:Uncharacterized protein n=1 Tax=Chlamydomonas reinhardtii TaxID=3055 RepID=A0A2K3CNM2_CHLRE|nr:uncharacterized protein CHLRE_17g696626v5 [Chlamydomonas reinhardtii]PNW69882.1 hypothetical protein CHLRE_17g696626v5 [Chlamydomonas reinhardtii]
MYPSCPLPPPPAPTSRPPCQFLAPEKLRGVGGLLLAPGSAARFANELGRRDQVAGAMAELPGRTAWLLLGAAAAAEYGSGALGFYCSKGLMTKAELPSRNQ